MVDKSVPHPSERGKGQIGALLDDQRSRWRRGEAVSVEAYLGRYPTLHADPERLLDLIFNEILVREERGEAPQLEEYERRFPHLVAQLRLQFGVYRAFPPVSPTTVLAQGQEARPEAPIVEKGRAGAPTFLGFEILGLLGQGGMGTVYRAYDRKRGEQVALKTLRHIEPAQLYRFKQEFRALADISHINLVNLYELISDGQNWFFTMELVDGVDFRSYVRVGAEPWDGGSEDTQTHLDHRLTSPPLVQLDRLRSVLRQLAEGIVALHEAGKLHRDIKPSNVLVTRRGRGVLLDFGLAAELGPTGIYQSTEEHILGTIAYMAPEQAGGLPVSPASDWYSVGAMLYEALTGQPPFLGRPLEVIMNKQRLDPPPPRQLVPGVPEDLDALCVDLLQRTPDARPTGRDVLRRIGSLSAESEVLTSSPSSSRQAVPLVGRQRHLEALANAFADVQRGRPVALYVHGCSGAGKTSLVQSFLDDLARCNRTVILKGRCYEQEAVPYKAVDGLIDTLSRYLGHLPDAEAQAVLPRDIGPLIRIFPVLRHAEAVAAAPQRGAEVPDPQELRRRAFAALRELLARLGDRRPLVLFIDDLQWGDVDSAALLSEILKPPDPPVLLLLGCYRSEDTTTSPLLRELLSLQQQADTALDQRELAVGSLSPSEACDLAMTLLGRNDFATRADAADIARESGGNPYFIHELVGYLKNGIEASAESSPPRDISLDEVLWDSITQLPEEAKRLLSVTAVAGRPLEQAIGCQAAGLGTTDRATLKLLRHRRLIRGKGQPEQDEIEAYHDRIRESVLAHLAPEDLRDTHRRLGLALEASGRADPEILGVHFHGAGETEKAGEYFTSAAVRAAEILAFDRAANLYRLALELRPVNDAARHSLRVAFGDALANAGRGLEAAREYRAASVGADVAEGNELRRRAAMQYLITGHVDEGLEVLGSVLRAVGMQLPAMPQRALWSVVVRRALIHLRGIGFRRRNVNEVPAGALTKIDICWSVVAGLSYIDPIRAADFQARNILLALRAGEPYRIARALAIEAGYATAVGVGSGKRRADRLLQAADEIAGQIDDPYLHGMVALQTGVVAYLTGDWSVACRSCARAEQFFRDRCTGVTWELDSLHMISLWSLTNMGEVAELGRRWPVLINEAQERGDLFFATTLNTYIMAIIRLAEDDPGVARETLDRVMKSWSHKGFHAQHHTSVLAKTHIDLYEGNGQAAWEALSKVGSAYAKSQLLKIRKIRVEVVQSRARCALAAAAHAADPRPFLQAAGRDVRRLMGERMPWAVAHAHLVAAGIAMVCNESSNAVALLRTAADRYDNANMHLYASVARRRLGEVLGSDEGRTLVDRADSWMAGQGIRNPARMAAMYAPGFPA